MPGWTSVKMHVSKYMLTKYPFNLKGLLEGKITSYLMGLKKMASSQSEVFLLFAIIYLASLLGVFMFEEKLIVYVEHTK